jgi:hypothetical protein
VEKNLKELSDRLRRFNKTLRFSVWLSGLSGKIVSTGDRLKKAWEMNIYTTS